MTMAESKETILFVDDEENILEISREYFLQKGYNVITASDGVEAADILEQRKVDCCFTDINMPNMDGLQLAEHIWKTDNTIPVVIMTGYPSLDNTIRTLKNGVVDFLIKPVNLQQMEICANRVLRERKLFIENILLHKEMESKARIERLNKELLLKVEELHCLNKIMKDVASISTSSDVYKHIVDMTIELTKANDAMFHVINDADRIPFEVAFCSSKLKTGIGTEHSIAEEHPEYKSAIEDIIKEVARDEIPLLIVKNSERIKLPQKIQSFMGVPLKIQDKVFGVLTAFCHKDNVSFVEKDLYYLSFMTERAAYAIENLALYEHINRGLITTLKAFVKAIEARDPYTKQHSNRVTEIAVVIGKAVGCTYEEIDILNIAGPLHDVGKIGIRDDILLKPGRLTFEEFEKIKEHPTIGADIVGQLGMWEDHQNIIRHHHERFDGTGYPDKLAGEDIPFLARILSVADAYDAMNSDRAYRRKMALEKILNIINEGAGTQFDPDIVDVFIALFREGKIVQ